MRPTRPFSRFVATSLNRRLGLNLFVFSMIGLAAVLLLLGAVIDDRFSRLEDQEIAGHIERTEAMLRRFEQTALSRALDWAVWDDSYAYLKQPNAAYEMGNLNLGSMQNIEVSAMSLVRFDGSFAKSLYFNLAQNKAQPRAAAAFERETRDPGFTKRVREQGRITGYMRVGERILVVAAAPILRSDETGTPQGYLVMGRELSDADVKQALQLPAAIFPATHASSVRIARSPEEATIRTLVRGLDREPVAMVEFTMPRALHREGTRLLWLTVTGVALLVTGLILLLNWRLRAVLIRPVAAFQAHVSRISKSGELAQFSHEKREDELGDLYREFNHMTDELGSLRAKVEAQSFAIGRSETAIDIMHNVGNAVSPVQAILGKLEQRLLLPAETNLRRALDELALDHTPPERRKALAAFLRLAIDALQSSLATHRSDVREGLRCLGHVHDAISAAKSGIDSAATGGACDLGAAIAASSAIARHSPIAAISVEVDAAECYRVALARPLLAQILDNLLTNAVEAIAATGRGSGTIRVTATHDADQPERFVLVHIRDDGDGFSPAEAERLFERGRSGREKLHGGFGLHWCANRIHSCGGTIDVSSNGVGCGAVVQIRLPLAAAPTETDQCQLAGAA